MRIVSLCPSLTELVFDLGRGEDLVGITRFCVHPADEVGAIEKVGGTKNPDVERIAALRPDVVLLNREENRIEDAEALAARGLHCHSSMPRTPGETAAMVRSIAVELERGETGETIALDIEELPHPHSVICRRKFLLSESFCRMIISIWQNFFKLI